MHIFVGNGAADGAFVDFGLFGNVFELHRFEVINAVFKKVALGTDNFFADPKNGFGPLVKRLNQKRRLPELAAKIFSGIFAASDPAAVFVVY